jgi:hypothetical protein
VQRLGAAGSELQPNDPVVVAVLKPADEPSALRPVDQADRAVMAQEQVLGHVADRRAAPIGMTSNGEQQLVLGRRDAGRLGLLLAPAQEAAEPGTELEQPPVVGIRDPA